MILVADSGGTGTGWMLQTPTETVECKTQGLHPGIVKPEQFQTVLQSVFPSFQEHVSAVYFYGTGCSGDSSKQKVATALKAVFKNASVSVDSDLTGAAVSVLGDEKGVVGILGTGMNVARCADGKIEKGIVSLGYMLGDEGSGVYIGKALLKAVLSDKLSEEVTQAFFDLLPYKRTEPDEIIAELYASERPNEWLGKFAKTAKELIHFPEVNHLIQTCFHDFACVVETLAGRAAPCKLGLVGSVAVHFKAEIEQALKPFKYSIEKVLDSPLSGIMEYHQG